MTKSLANILTSYPRFFLFLKTILYARPLSSSPAKQPETACIPIVSSIMSQDSFPHKNEKEARHLSGGE
jgi:hypothetical protein